MGPASDNAGYSGCSHFRISMYMSLQWVRRRITPVMGAAVPADGEASVLQWVRRRITPVMEKPQARLASPRTTSMGQASDNAGYAYYLVPPRIPLTTFNGSGVG